LRASELRLRRFVVSGDEVVRVEKVKIERFMTLGLGRYEAIRAVEDSHASKSRKKQKRRS
jgi:hypothetical protein